MSPEGGIAMRNNFVRLTTVFFFFGLSSGFMSCNDTASTAIPPAQQPAEQPHVTISIPAGATNLGDQGFGENPKAIQTGTLVTWVNDDSTPHDVHSDDGVLFGSGVLNPGDHFDWLANAAGTVTYHCNLHPGMTGTLEIGTGPSPSPSPSESPSPSPSPSPSSSPMVR